MRSFGCALTLAALVALSGNALSQPEPRGEEAAQQADEHFLKGKALLKAGNVRGAYAEYKIAWGLKRTYDIAANLGNLELSQGMPRDAAEHLAFSVRNYALTGTTPERLEKTKQLLAQARAQVGVLTIQVNVDGAEVLIDGRTVGRSPIAEEVYVDPGSRTVEARLGTYRTAQATITAEKGSSQQVTLKLDAAAPPPTATGTVEPPPPGPNKMVLATGGAAAGAGLVLGAVFAGVSSSKAGGASTKRGTLTASGGPAACNGAAEATPACSALADDITAKRTFANAAVWSFVGAGAVGAGTLLYALAAPKRPAKAGLRVVPSASAQGAGVQIGGTW